MAIKQRRTIKEYWTQKSEELERKPRDFYKTFKPFLSAKSRRDDATISIKINERMESNPKAVSEEFGDYFSTMANVIGGDHVLQLEEQAFDNHPSMGAIRQAYQDLVLPFEFSEIENSAVEKEMKNLDTNKSAVRDNTSPKLLKLIAKELAPSLTTLFNTVIRKGQWPDDWKRESGHLWWERVNYRPITVLILVDKIFEGLLSKQITEVFDPHLYHKMSAYRKTHS